jgi:hypothetical protein
MAFFSLLVNKQMSRIDDIDVLEGPLRSMLFDVVHSVCSEFMNEVLRKCVEAPHATVQTLPGIIQCAVTTVQRWTTVQRDAQARKAIHMQPGLPLILSRVLDEYRVHLDKAGFTTNGTDGDLGTFIHNTLLGVVSDDHGLVLRLEYFRQSAEAWTARWLLHRQCMRKALIMELAPTPVAPAPVAPHSPRRADPRVEPDDSVSNVDAPITVDIKPVDSLRERRRPERRASRHQQMRAASGGSLPASPRGSLPASPRAASGGSLPASPRAASGGSLPASPRAASIDSPSLPDKIESVSEPEMDGGAPAVL